MKASLIAAYIATLISALALDAVWLSVMATVLYRPVIGDALLDQFRLLPAILFYLGYALALIFFAVRPALTTRTLSTACLYGAALGLAAYGTYDLTNQATLKHWSTTLTLADLGWGATLSAASSCVGYLVAARFGHERAGR